MLYVFFFVSIPTFALLDFDECPFACGESVHAGSARE